jgi:hypothetical protein
MSMWEMIQGYWRRHQQLMVLILVSLVLRIAWIAYTGYVAEDAFITFRFAQNLTEAHGFVYNPGQRIYGTTTPLFTLLMALWGLLWKDPVPGALLINVLAGLGTLYFTHKALEKIRFSPSQRLFALLLLISAPKLLYLEVQGMEIPLLLFFMAASWSTFLDDRWSWTGILLGCLLWVRIDTVLWVAIIAWAAFSRDRRAGIIVTGFATATYLPWFLFAFIYFGSPVPFTIIAKYWAYGIRGHTYNAGGIEPIFSMLLFRLKLVWDVLEGSSPYTLSPRMDVIDDLATLLSVALTSLGTILAIRKQKMRLTLGFLMLEILRLAVFRITFFSRYFIAVIWIICLVSGYFLGSLWDRGKKGLLLRSLATFLPTVLFLSNIYQVISGAGYYHDVQQYRHHASLQAIGKWMRLNLDKETVVQLEPLGYIGYYSGLIMLDEVGLITPEVVHMKQLDIDQPLQVLEILDPDVFVSHCDDARRISEGRGRIEVGEQAVYEFMIRFDPLESLDTARESQGDRALARASCYEVWGRSELKR